MKNLNKYRIPLKDIPEYGLKFEEKIPIDYIKDFEAGIFKEPIFLSCEVFSSGDGAKSTGSVSFVIEFECCRCLEKFSLSMKSPYSIKIKKSVLLEEDVNLEDEIFYIDEEFIDLADIALEQVALSLPMHPLCDEKCKGLCPQCGKNRNEEECSCRNANPDPKFAVLESLKKIFENNV